MKVYLITILVLCIYTHFSLAQQDINYDESKVPIYALPELLVLENGKKVTKKKQWMRYRRPKVLEVFSSQMYGRTPKDDIQVYYETLTENSNDLNGRATSKQVRFTFTNGEKNIEAILLMYTPNKTHGKVPFFIGYNFKGNHSTSFDTTILYSPSLHLLNEPTHPDWERGCQVNSGPFEDILDRGCGVATMCYHDIFRDKEGLKDHSIVSLFPDYDPNLSSSHEWQDIGAWAWGSSRIVDYLETQKYIDRKKIAIMGHSRQGKAALWAGAQDTRLRIVIANNSGSGGAALSKRQFGETIDRVTSIKPAWFCPAMRQYANNEANLPFDQHWLIALNAPRPVYIASAEEDLWRSEE